MDGGSPDIRGLSEKEAASRLKAEGPNTLPQADRRTFVRIVLEILREPMFALLLGAAAIYLVLGDLKEAVVLGILKQWTEANIGNALAGRDIARHLRELGEITRGPPPLSKQDRSRFLSALDTAVRAALREGSRG